jgi:hypothetical protein
MIENRHCCKRGSKLAQGRVRSNRCKCANVAKVSNSIMSLCRTYVRLPHLRFNRRLSGLSNKAVESRTAERFDKAKFRDLRSPTSNVHFGYSLTGRQALNDKHVR